MLPEKDATALPRTGQIAKDRQGELLERRLQFHDALQAWDEPGLSGLLLTRLVQATEVVAGLEDVVADFLRHVQRQGRPRKAVQTYCAIWPATLLVEDLHQNLDRVRVLQDLEKRRAHRQMLDCLEHMHQMLRIEQFARPQ